MLGETLLSIKLTAYFDFSIKAHLLRQIQYRATRLSSLLIEILHKYSDIGYLNRSR